MDSYKKKDIVCMVRCMGTAKEIPPVTATQALGPITWGLVYQR